MKLSYKAWTAFSGLTLSLALLGGCNTEETPSDAPPAAATPPGPGMEGEAPTPPPTTATPPSTEPAPPVEAPGKAEEKKAEEPAPEKKAEEAPKEEEKK